MESAPESPHAHFRLRPFRPSWWAPGPHAQTLAGKLLRPVLPLARVRERWETPDGDFLDVDLGPAPAAGDAPVVVILHGLEGSSRRGYVLHAHDRLVRRGIQAVGLNFRSCSGEPNRLPRGYHSGETGDLAFVLERLAARFPGRPLGAVGFSLGGNILLKLLGEQGAGARRWLQAAAAISVPYDLADGATCLEASLMGRFYSHYFLRSLRAKTRLKAKLLRDRIAVAAALTARTIREFDEVATAPLHGFEGAAQYYRESSCAGYLAEIRVPTLLLHALDDPFLTPAAIPFQAIAGNPALVQGFVRRGGHVGFVEGPPTAPRFWAEEEAARFLQGALGPGLPKETLTNGLPAP